MLFTHSFWKKYTWFSKYYITELLRYFDYYHYSTDNSSLPQPNLATQPSYPTSY